MKLKNQFKLAELIRSTRRRRPMSVELYTMGVFAETEQPVWLVRGVEVLNRKLAQATESLDCFLIHEQFNSFCILLMLNNL